MIVLFTDFGVSGPYIGQMKAVLHREAPGEPVIDLFADAPMRDPRAAAYLLAAYAAWFPAGTIVLAVVDPGVGGTRPPVVVEADGIRYVGPGNGLFELVRRRAKTAVVAEIAWPPPALSASFHGRDLFAPVAAMLARGAAPELQLRDAAWQRQPDWPDDLAEIVYIDHYGNAMTGLRAAAVPAEAVLAVRGTQIQSAHTFSSVPAGSAFWYGNSNGLVEIAVNMGRADRVLELVPGTIVRIEEGVAS
jgi:S-adenosyl-L-methionine hydrolase (adenosine-forming)